MTRPLVLVDLDDSLFQTEAKCPPETRGLLVHAATARNGRHSYMTPAQKNFADWLLANAETVPVTARGTAAFAAVAIDFTDRAIVANGAVLLDRQGVVDPDWQRRMQRDLAPFERALRQLLAVGKTLGETRELSIRSWIVEETGFGAYAVFKENDVGSLSRLAEALPAPDGWRRHRNGNNLSYLPPPISKRKAAAHLIEEARRQSPHRPVIGFADSVSDFDFLSLCDWWASPAGSQISQAMAPITDWFSLQAPDMASHGTVG